MKDLDTQSLTSREIAAQRARSTQAKFKQQVFLGTGGAIVFGLVAAFGTKLLGLVAASGGSALPVLGLVAIAAAGIGCIYLGARYMSEAISIDQDAQARKIQEAARARSNDVAITVEPERTTTLPLQPAGFQPHDTPDHIVHHAEHQQRLADAHQHARA